MKSSRLTLLTLLMPSAHISTIALGCSNCHNKSYWTSQYVFFTSVWFCWVVITSLITPIFGSFYELPLFRERPAIEVWGWVPPLRCPGGQHFQMKSLRTLATVTIRVCLCDVSLKTSTRSFVKRRWYFKTPLVVVEDRSSILGMVFVRCNYPRLVCTFCLSLTLSDASFVHHCVRLFVCVCLGCVCLCMWSLMIIIKLCVFYSWWWILRVTTILHLLAKCFKAFLSF